jgi:hypothetical protein
MNSESLDFPMRGEVGGALGRDDADGDIYHRLRLVVYTCTSHTTDNPLHSLVVLVVVVVLTSVASVVLSEWVLLLGSGGSGEIPHCSMAPFM